MSENASSHVWPTSSAARSSTKDRSPTRSTWDHGAFRVGEHTVPYLNEYMAIEGPSGRVATYPDTIFILRKDNGLPLAVKDAVEGLEVTLVKVAATALPLSSSAVDRVAVGECEDIMGIDFLRYLPERQERG